MIQIYWKNCSILILLLNFDFINKKPSTLRGFLNGLSDPSFFIIEAETTPIVALDLPVPTSRLLLAE